MGLASGISCLSANISIINLEQEDPSSLLIARLILMYCHAKRSKVTWPEPRLKAALEDLLWTIQFAIISKGQAHIYITSFPRKACHDILISLQIGSQKPDANKNYILCLVDFSIPDLPHSSERPLRIPCSCSTGLKSQYGCERWEVRSISSF